MFCRKCGIKLDLSKSTCPNCGEDVSKAEYCGGFWGIVGEEKKKDEDEQEKIHEKGIVGEEHNEINVEQEIDDINELKKDAGNSIAEVLREKMRIIACIVIAVLIVIILVLNSKIKNLNSQSDRSDRRSEINDNKISREETSKDVDRKVEEDGSVELFLDDYKYAEGEKIYLINIREIIKDYDKNCSIKKVEVKLENENDYIELNKCDYIELNIDNYADIEKLEDIKEIKITLKKEGQETQNSFNVIYNENENSLALEPYDENDGTKTLEPQPEETSTDIEPSSTPSFVSQSN